MTSAMMGCMKARLYTDTLVLVFSSLTVQELVATPADVRGRLAAVPEAHIENLQ